MAGKKDYESEAEKLLGPIAEENGVRIYDVEYVKEGSDYYLRAYIDKDGGVTIDDCEAVSRRYSDVLDEADLIKDPYILEVSSPGLGRSLKKDKHFEKSIGEDVELKFYKPIDGSKNAEGTLKAFDEKTVTITVNGEDKTYNRTDLADVRLAIDF